MSRISNLPPYPNGWYCLGYSDELKPGTLITQKFAGQEVVLFRTESGKLNAIEAYCPHLGAHFGHGGKVQGEEIKCPFHGFCFNGSGICTSTPYGTKPPPTAVAKTWYVSDINGFILIFHHAENKKPDWFIPTLDFTGWTPFHQTQFEITSHPQETTENSVDIGHFNVVHGYTGVEVLKPLVTEGPYLTSKYAMERKADFLGLSSKVRSEFEVHVHGLGYSYVDAKVPKLGLEFGYFVLSTPLGNNKIILRLAMHMKKIIHPGKINPFLALLPKFLVNQIISSTSFKGYVHDVKQDFDIWENKVYIAPPALAKGDGPVGKYRTWTKQFYKKEDLPVLSTLTG